MPAVSSANATEEEKTRTNATTASFKCDRPCRRRRRAWRQEEEAWGASETWPGGGPEASRGAWRDRVGWVSAAGSALGATAEAAEEDRRREQEQGREREQ